MPYQAADGETKALASVPGLDIEIRHSQSPDGRSEHIAIHMTATPSFDAFASSVRLFNPFVFWAEAMRLAWAPWAGAFPVLPPPSRRDPVDDDSRAQADYGAFRG